VHAVPPHPHPYPTSAPAAAGLIGTAPSAELLAIWNERERKLNADGPDAVTLGGARPGPGTALLELSTRVDDELQCARRACMPWHPLSKKEGASLVQRGTPHGISSIFVAPSSASAFAAWRDCSSLAP